MSEVGIYTIIDLLNSQNKDFDSQLVKNVIEGHSKTCNRENQSEFEVLYGIAGYIYALLLLHS